MAATHPPHPGESWLRHPADARPFVLSALRALAGRMRRRFLAFAWELEAEGGYSLAARPGEGEVPASRKKPLDRR